MSLDVQDPARRRRKSGPTRVRVPTLTLSRVARAMLLGSLVACADAAPITAPDVSRPQPADVRRPLAASAADISMMRRTVDDALARVLPALGVSAEVAEVRGALTSLQMALAADDAALTARALGRVDAAIAADLAAHEAHGPDLSAIELAIASAVEASLGTR